MKEIDEVTLRSKLKRKRDSLFEVFRRHPSKTRLAIEIKLIDDQIASLADKGQQTCDATYFAGCLTIEGVSKQQGYSNCAIGPAISRHDSADKEVACFHVG